MSRIKWLAVRFRPGKQHRAAAPGTPRQGLDPTPDVGVFVESYGEAATPRDQAGHRQCQRDRVGTSNGPTEAINGCLEHLRGSALGFRNLANYIARSLLEAGGFRSQLHTQIG